MNGTKHEPKFSDRIRFNWGYHDGAADEKDGIRPPWTLVQTREQKRAQDAAYMDGYEAGEAAQVAGIYAGDSTKAWDERVAR